MEENTSLQYLWSILNNDKSKSCECCGKCFIGEKSKGNLAAHKKHCSSKHHKPIIKLNFQLFRLKPEEYLCQFGCEGVWTTTTEVALHMIGNHSAEEMLLFGMFYQEIQIFAHKRDTVLPQFPKQITSNYHVKTDRRVKDQQIKQMLESQRMSTKGMAQSTTGKKAE